MPMKLRLPRQLGQARFDQLGLRDQSNVFQYWRLSFIEQNRWSDNSHEKTESKLSWSKKHIAATT